MKRRTAVLVCAVVGGFLANSQADFSLLDDFESYTTGAITNQSANWSSAGTVFGATVGSSAGNQYLNQGTENNTHTIYDNGSTLIADGAIGTYFFRAFMPGASHTATSISSVGAADSDAWGDGKAIVRFGTNPANNDIFAYDASTYSNLTNGQSSAWYNVWVLIDNSDGNRNYDLYIQSDDDANFSTQTSIGTDLGFRQNAADGDLQSLFFRTAITSGDTYYDDLYIDSTTHNLINPIPEPGTLGLVGVFGGAVLFVRRRFLI